MKNKKDKKVERKIGKNIKKIDTEMKIGIKMAKNKKQKDKKTRKIQDQQDRIKN